MGNADNTFTLALAPALALLIAGCAPSSPTGDRAPTAPPRTPLTYYSTPPSKDAALLAALNRDGVKTLQEGDRMRLVLPVDSFFDPLTDEIDPARYAVLNTIAQFLARPKTQAHILVSGHTDNVAPPAGKIDHSFQQAQNVAAYLWAHGVPREKLSIVGLADDRPVANDLTPASSQINRRIEIQFRQ